MQCMKDEIEKYTDLNNDYSFSIAYKSLITIENVSQFKKWAIHKVRELQNITVSIERLNSAINNFFADSDAAWDTISDVVASEKVFAYESHVCQGDRPAASITWVMMKHYPPTN